MSDAPSDSPTGRPSTDASRQEPESQEMGALPPVSLEAAMSKVVIFLCSERYDHGVESSEHGDPGTESSSAHSGEAVSQAVLECDEETLGNLRAISCTVHQFLQIVYESVVTIYRCVREGVWHPDLTGKTLGRWEQIPKEDRRIPPGPIDELLETLSCMGPRMFELLSACTVSSLLQVVKLRDKKSKNTQDLTSYSHLRASLRQHSRRMLAQRNMWMSSMAIAKAIRATMCGDETDANPATTPAPESTPLLTTSTISALYRHSELRSALVAIDKGFSYWDAPGKGEPIVDPQGKPFPPGVLRLSLLRRLRFEPQRLTDSNRDEKIMAEHIDSSDESLIFTENRKLRVPLRLRLSNIPKLDGDVSTLQ